MKTIPKHCFSLRALRALRGESSPVRRRGLTLVEVAVSIAIVSAVVLAAMMARYASVRQARRADAYNGAGRLALLLLEGWRSYATPTDYTPVINFGPSSPVHLAIETSAAGPSLPTGFTQLGRYRVQMDNVNFYVTLSYYVNPTVTVPRTPSKLHAAVAFRNDFQQGTLASSDPVVRLTTYD